MAIGKHGSALFHGFARCIDLDQINRAAMRMPASLALLSQGILSMRGWGA